MVFSNTVFLFLFLPCVIILYNVNIINEFARCVKDTLGGDCEVPHGESSAK